MAPCAVEQMVGLDSPTYMCASERTWRPFGSCTKRVWEMGLFRNFGLAVAVSGVVLSPRYQERQGLWCGERGGAASCFSVTCLHPAMRGPLGRSIVLLYRMWDGVSRVEGGQLWRSGAGDSSQGDLYPEWPCGLSCGARPSPKKTFELFVLLRSA